MFLSLIYHLLTKILIAGYHFPGRSHGSPPLCPLSLNPAHISYVKLHYDCILFLYSALKLKPIEDKDCSIWLIVSLVIIIGLTSIQY